MAIIFSSGSQINSAYSANSANPRLNIGYGGIVQTVYTTYTSNFSTSSSSFTNWASLAINIRPGNKVLAEYHMKTREDNGNGTWNLSRHRLRVSKNGASATELINTGFHGAQANTIYQNNMHYLWDPAGAGGTHTFYADASGWSGTMYFNRSGGNGDGIAWLVLHEIANA